MSKKEQRSIFIEMFGDTPSNKVLDFLLCEGRTWDYSLTDIEKQTGVSWPTLSKIWPRFVKDEIVVQTRKFGKTRLYKLNEKNPRVKLLIRIDYILSKTAIRQKLKLETDSEKDLKDLENVFVAP